MQVSATCVLVSISEYSVVVFCLVPEEFIGILFIFENCVDGTLTIVMGLSTLLWSRIHWGPDPCQRYFWLAFMKMEGRKGAYVHHHHQVPFHPVKPPEPDTPAQNNTYAKSLATLHTSLPSKYHSLGLPPAYALAPPVTGPASLVRENGPNRMW
jgi:hypothetical protein